MKAEDDRLEQTIKYIGKTPHFPTAYRGAVKAFVEAYAGRAQWPGKYVLPIAKTYGDYQRFSAEMTMTDVHSPGNADERAMRRAIFLLYSALEQSQAAATAKSMLVGRVKAEFVGAMWKALCLADERSGLSRGPAALYGELRDRTLETLRLFKIHVNGVTRTDAVNSTNQVDFVFRYNQATDRFAFDPASSHNNGAGMCLIVGTTSIPAIQWDQVPGRGTTFGTGSFAGMRGTHFAGSLMVTTQLTGCCVCVQDVGGTLVGSHIKPDVTVDGTTLARQLDGVEPNVVGGGWSNPPLGAAGALRVFGRGHASLPGDRPGYDVRLLGRDKYATVIGINRPSGWHLYCQELYDGDIINARKIL